MAKAPAKKAAPAKKTTTVKKAAARKAAAPAKKTATAKRAAGRATTAKRPAAKAPAKKAVPARKPAAKKVAKAPVKKAPAKKAPARAAAKAPVKKTAPAKKAPAKKAAKPDPPVKKQPAGTVCPLSGMFVPKQSPNITPKTLERLKEILLEERARHLRQAADLQAEAEALVSEREQGDTQFDEESGEGDTISVERERDLMLSATARQAVEEIDRALARMDDGTYGLCTPAGRRIAVARLEAIPWAETCVDCKQRVERRR